MPAALDALRGEKYLSLETFKRDGTGVKTPVWFAHDGASLVYMTDGRSWRCKRLRRNDACKVAACDIRGGIRGGVRGTWFDGVCHPIDGAEAEAAEAQLVKKYWVAMRIGTVLSRAAGRHKRRKYYRITFPGAA